MLHVRITMCSLCIMSSCKLTCFPFRFRVREFGSGAPVHVHCLLFCLSHHAYLFGLINVVIHEPCSSKYIPSIDVGKGDVNQNSEMYKSSHQ